MRQLMLFELPDLFVRPDDGMLCDSCRKLVWHRSGDGYCCCMAPGMAHINRRTRKPLGASCRFFDRRDV